VADTNVDRYRVVESLILKQEPTWPDVSFPEILRIAFEDRLVDSIDHPMLGNPR
jgi:hypothetical protein